MFPFFRSKKASVWAYFGSVGRNSWALRHQAIASSRLFSPRTTPKLYAAAAICWIGLHRCPQRLLCLGQSALFAQGAAQVEVGGCVVRFNF